MRKLILLALLGGGCAAGTYTYSFDLTDPGARNVQKPGQHDVLEDADIKSEILVDPTSFQAVMFDLTNKTDAPIEVQWGAISIIGPDRVQLPLRPDGSLGAVESGAKLTARLVPFQLPSEGAAAKAYDNTDFELVVPMIVRANPREVRYHLHARAIKL
jgi:hypothetical protein